MVFDDELEAVHETRAAEKDPGPAPVGSRDRTQDSQLQARRLPLRAPSAARGDQVNSFRSLAAAMSSS
jgi:hypothetical protein